MNDAQKTELAEVASEACKKALENIPFDVRCLDWASYTPDFFIEQSQAKAA